ncbi:hypothetical protein EDB83DRAFT_2404124 [Lactarius deliciosus]|nr:hypothetical protein EDB83DRAFT_2404124 [Lactarius deliciosus]
MSMFFLHIRLFYSVDKLYPLIILLTWTNSWPGASSSESLCHALYVPANLASPTSLSTSLCMLSLYTVCLRGSSN